MAKRTGPSDKTVFIRLCSFWALLIAAALLILSGVFNKLGLGVIVQIFDLVGKVFLLFGIAIPAYDYTRGKGTAWKVLYWVALVVYIVGCVLGML